MSNTNLAIWDAVEATDPAFTKNYKKGGGYSGTAINATWLVKQATAKFGPIGIGWGVNVVDESIIDIENGEKVHRLLAEIWYMHDGQRGSVFHFGQTMLVSKRQSGLFVDEDFAKKSLTDATTKALSLLGFAGDVHQGFYEDNKYVQAMDREFEERDRQEKIAKAKKPELPSPPKTEETNSDKGNVVPMKPQTKMVDGVKVDDDGVVQDDGARSEEISVESTIEKVKALETIESVSAYMTSGEAGTIRETLSKPDWEKVREAATQRLKDLGWPSGNKKDAKAKP